MKKIDTKDLCLPADISNKYGGFDCSNNGGYGKVFFKKNCDNPMAVKLTVFEPDFGLSGTSIREISLMRSIPPHPNVLKERKIEIISPKPGFYSDDRVLGGVLICMDYMSGGNFEKNFREPSFKWNTKKKYFYDILLGLDHLHSNKIMHRDLKPQNILLRSLDKSDESAVICDYGLGRDLSNPIAPLASNGVTIQYRPPELLCGCKKYSFAVDMWSMGCILGEMGVYKNFFDLEKAHTSRPRRVDIFNKDIFDRDNFCLAHYIFEKLGGPYTLTNTNELTWPNFKEDCPDCPFFLCEEYQKILSYPKNSLMEMMTPEHRSDRLYMDLLEKLLQIDPRKRLTAKEALKHEFFKDII